MSKENKKNLFIPEISDLKRKQESQTLKRLSNLESRESGIVESGGFEPPLTQLRDTTFGQLFNAYTATTPDGWTEQDAAASSSMSYGENKGVWTLRSTSGNNDWHYHKQFNITSSDYAGSLSVYFNQIYLRENALFNDADVTWTLGVHSDSGLGIPGNNSNLLDIKLSNSLNILMIRQRYVVSGIGYSGHWQHLPPFYPQPYYARLTVSGLNGGGTNLLSAYWGTNAFYQSQRCVGAESSSSIDFENPYVSIERTSTGSMTDFFHIGAIDFWSFY